MTNMNNFPPSPTPFIGRATEIAEITGRLADPACRLLSLVGPGGIGKTRLAIEVARQLPELFAHGSYFVALHPLPAAVSLVSAVAEALNFPYLPTGRRHAPGLRIGRFLGQNYDLCGHRR